MVGLTKFDIFSENLAEGVHNLGADLLTLALSNTAPSAANTIFANITEISAGNGYTAGGQAITVTASSQTSGTYKLVADDEVFTATGGAIATFRYVVFYNDSPTGPVDPLIGWYDNGATVDLADGETFTVDFNQSTGVLTVA